jgi:hypothetical protein
MPNLRAQYNRGLFLNHSELDWASVVALHWCFEVESPFHLVIATSPNLVSCLL